MKLDPHTLQQIVKRIEQQLRCPQCSGRVPVNFSSVQVMNEEFALFQVRCSSCDAFIVLNASLKGIDRLGFQEPGETAMKNRSTLYVAEESEKQQIEQKISEAGGSFGTLFGYKE